MRVPCALLALLAGVSAVSGASIELSFGPDTTGTVDEVDVEGVTIPRVTLRGSDFAYIDIVLQEAADGLAFWYLGTSTDGETTDLFTFEEVIPGPDMLESPDQPAPGDLLNDWRGANYVYPYVVDGGDFLLVTLVIHCTGAAGETLVMLDDLAGEAFVTRGDLSDYHLDFAAMVLVRQLAAEVGGGGGGLPADDGEDPDAGDDPTDDPADGDDGPTDPGSGDTDDDGLTDADDPDDDDDGVPDEQDADPHDPGVGASADDDGGSTVGGSSGGGSRAARAPCGAGMITALPLALLGGCGLAVRCRSGRRGGVDADTRSRE